MGILEAGGDLVNWCCPSCCRAADLGSHDYCLECDTNPCCTNSLAEDWVVIDGRDGNKEGGKHEKKAKKSKRGLKEKGGDSK